MTADKTLIEGARRVAETKATAAMGAQAFQKGLQAAKPKQSVAQKLSAALDKRDAEVKQTNAELKKFYENRSVLDQSAVTDPRYQGTFGNKLKEWKTVYNEGASQAVKNREDVQSEAYQQGVDAMNGRNQAIQRLTTQVQKFDRLKSDFKKLITEEGGLSLGIPKEKREQVEAIFGEGKTAMEIDNDGFITFRLENDKTIKLDDFEMPEPKNTAFRDAVAARSAAISQGKEVITPEVAASNKNAYEKLLDTEDAIRSGLADYRGEFENQFDAIEGKLEAGKDDEGNPYDVFAARDEMIELLVQGEVTLSKEYNRKKIEKTDGKEYKYAGEIEVIKNLPNDGGSVDVKGRTIEWDEKNKRWAVTYNNSVRFWDNLQEMIDSLDWLNERVK